MTKVGERAFLARLLSRHHSREPLARSLDHRSSNEGRIMERKILTHNAEDDGRPIGVGYYLPGFKDQWRYTKWVVKRDYPNGWRRIVWVDRDCRSLMIGWFYAD